jgi:myo-inositol-1(or 4)-monophosphatase
MYTPRAIAIDAALEAGRVLRSYFGEIDGIDFKGEIDIVTEADREAERIVLERLVNAFPAFALLGEETGAHDGDTDGAGRWIVDPLDGTTNFANGYPHFCVSIALELKGTLELGVVYAPMVDELLIAQQGQGAWLNGERMHVSRSDRLINSVVSTGFEYDRDKRDSNLGRFAWFTHETRAVRRDGSAAIDLCYVAAGRFDGFWEAGLNPWDVAAGALLVTESGGRITDYAGNEFRIDSPNCVASNGLIHRDMLAGVQAAGGRGTGR